MHVATGFIGKRTHLSDQKPLNPGSVRRILISRPNHRLGNMLLITPLIQDVQRVFPNATIDFFVKGGVAPTLLKQYDHVGRFITLPRKHFKQFGHYLKGWLTLLTRRYDLVINTVNNSSSGRLSVLFARSSHKLYGNEGGASIKKAPDWQHIAKHPVYCFRHALTEWGIPDEGATMPVLNLKLTDAERKKGQSRLEALVPDPSRQTICLYTYATGAKCYASDWWLPFLDQLKHAFPAYNILEILPVEHVSRIDFREPYLYSKDVREMAAVMSNTAVLITADCGIMHLASAAQAPIVALFSVTNPLVYGPYNTGSVSLKTEGLETNAILEAINGVLGL